MRPLAILLCVLVQIVQNIQAQEATNRPLTPPTSEPLASMQVLRQANTSPITLVKSEQSFSVQFTEFRYKHATDIDVHRTSEEILMSFDKLLKEGKIELIESIRLTALENHDSSVQFGKNTSVTSGVSRTPQGIQQSRQSVSIGTKVQIKPIPQEEKVLLDVSYNVSRMDSNAPEDRLQDVVTVQLNSKLLLEIGKATLVGGFSSDENDFLLVTIRK